MTPNFLAVWWHCLWRMFQPGHRMCEVKITGQFMQSFCECGYRDYNGYAVVFSVSDGGAK